MDALGPVLGPAVIAMHESVQAPVALCGQSVLAAASLAAQAHADVVIDGRRTLLTIWAATIAVSGERKSGIDEIALAPHHAHEAALLSRHRVAMLEHHMNVDAWTAAIDKVKRSAKAGVLPAALRAAMDQCGPKPVPPPGVLLLCREPTVEGVARLYLEGVSSLGIFTDEGGEFFGGHAMKPENQTRTISAMSTVWSRGCMDRIRSGDGASKMFGRRLAMHVMVTPVIAAEILGDAKLAGQGFLARTLTAWPVSTVGTRMYRAVDTAADPRVIAYAGRMTELLSRAAPLKADGHGELAPRELGLTPDAKRAWVAFLNEIEVATKPGGIYSGVGPWASKAAEQAQRIAGVLALVASPDARVVDLAEIESGARLMRFYLSEAVRLIDTAAVPAIVREAEIVLDWIRTRGLSVVDATMLLHLGPNSLRSEKKYKPVMAKLVETGWAELVTDAVINGRKPKQAWAFHPSALTGGANPANPANPTHPISGISGISSNAAHLTRFLVEDAFGNLRL